MDKVLDLSNFEPMVDLRFVGLVQNRENHLFVIKTKSRHYYVVCVGSAKNHVLADKHGEPIRYTNQPDANDFLNSLGIKDPLLVK